ncbi:TPA: hypothetical protein R3U69_002298 [Escherichia coli]|nr:hypothetical protein [Escherichia coli]HEC5174623.1 hypothetical protein [Escherichia coli]
MFLHLVPKILHPMGNICSLDSVSVPELSLHLTDNDLVVMRPYPNKQYLVGMLKGRRALNGFLVKCPRALEEFTMVSVWNIEGFGKITHTLKTFVEDTDYDLVSHDVLLALGSYRAPASEECRVHSVYKNIAPVYIEPKMESLLLTEPNFENDTCETYSWGMLVRTRKEGFKAMTVPSARLRKSGALRGDRLPQPEQAIVISG